MKLCSNCKLPGHYAKTCKVGKAQPSAALPKAQEATSSIPEKSEAPDVSETVTIPEYNSGELDSSLSSEGPEIKPELLVKTTGELIYVEGFYYYIQVGKGTTYKFGSYASDKAALNAMLVYNKRMQHHPFLCISQLFVFRDGNMQEIVAK